jgi:hypothetical protein
MRWLSVATLAIQVGEDGQGGSTVSECVWTVALMSIASIDTRISATPIWAACNEDMGSGLKEYSRGLRPPMTLRKKDGLSIDVRLSYHFPDAFAKPLLMLSLITSLWWELRTTDAGSP